MQLTGLRIALRMGRIAARQGALKIRCPNGVQLVRHLVGSGTRLDDGVRPARVNNDIGVRREVHPVYDRPGVRILPQRSGHIRRANPSIPIPASFAIFDSDSVDHPVAREPMVRSGVRWQDRVGAIAEITAAQGARKGAGYRQIGHRFFAGDRGVVAQQIRIGQWHRCLLYLQRQLYPIDRGARSKSLLRGSPFGAPKGPEVITTFLLREQKSRCSRGGGSWRGRVSVGHQLFPLRPGLPRHV